MAYLKFDVSILSTDEYLPEEIVGQDIPEKYLYDEKGHFCLTATIFDSEKPVQQLIDFLFQGIYQAAEVYRNTNVYILDLSSYRDQLVDVDDIERYYPKWLENTGRENSMNEYGMLIDFAGHIKQGLNRKYLLMIVSNERHLSIQHIHFM
jgi:hypothetical protein